MAGHCRGNFFVPAHYRRASPPRRHSPPSAHRRRRRLPLIHSGPQAAFEVRLCKSAFAIEPQVAPLQPAGVGAWSFWLGAYGYTVDGRPQTDELWLLPNATELPRAVVSFRDETSLNGRLLIVWLILVRFIFCNLANSQWQEMGTSVRDLFINTCGCSRANPEAAGKYYVSERFPLISILQEVFTHEMVQVLALIFSLWSLIHLGDDASMCRYPTEFGAGVENGYCSVVVPDSVAGGYGQNVASRLFEADCGLQKATGWNESRAGLFQVYSVNDQLNQGYIDMKAVGGSAGTAVQFVPSVRDKIYLEGIRLAKAKARNASDIPVLPLSFAPVQRPRRPPS